MVTAFVIESYQSLQLDNAAYTATALYILVAAGNNPTGISLPPPPDLGFNSSASRWVNGLFFTSILLSLVVAFLSILVKQWITEYRSRNRKSAKSPRDWARRRSLYAEALERWPVADVVSLLPVLLHLSLFLFFVGLVLFLWDLDQAIGRWIISLTAMLGALYLACTLIPFWIPECPTATPTVHELRKVARLTVLSIFRFASWLALHNPSLIMRRIRLAPGELFLTVKSAVLTFVGAIVRVGHSAVLIVQCRAQPSPAMISRNAPEDAGDLFFRGMFYQTMGDDPPPPFSGVIECIRKLLEDRVALDHRIEQSRDHLDAFALTWLMFDVSDSDAVAVGWQALGSIHPCAALADLMRADMRLNAFSNESTFTRSTAARSPAEIIRVARSILCATGMSYALKKRVPALYTNEGGYPDLAVLQACGDFSRQFTIADAERYVYCDASTSLTSTAIHVLSTGVHFPDCLLYLHICDFSRFSDSDWDVVLRHVTISADRYVSYAEVSLERPCFDSYRDTWAEPLAVSSACKPLYMAAFLTDCSARMDPQRAFKHLIDQLVLRILSQANVPEKNGKSPWRLNAIAFPALKSSMLDFLTSDGFVGEYSKNQPALEAIALWMCSSQGAIHVLPSSSTQRTFWYMLAHAANAAVLHGFVDVSGEIMRFCRQRLIDCCGSGAGLTVVCDGILRPCPSPLVGKSLWALLSQANQAEPLTSSYARGYWLALAQTLAATLSIQSRRRARGEAVEEAIPYVREFFTELDPLPFQGGYRLNMGFLDVVWTGPGINMTHGESIAHLIQHCREVEPSWSPNFSHYSNGTEYERRAMVALSGEPSRSGPCRWCPPRLLRCAQAL